MVPWSPWLALSRYAEKGANWPFPIQALGPGAQCLMNTRKDGTPDGTNSGTYCNNYPENNYSQEHYFQERAHGPPHLKYCGTGDYLCRGYNETVIQDGWFYDLADLDQSVPFVREFLKDWVKYMAWSLVSDWPKNKWFTGRSPSGSAGLVGWFQHVASWFPRVSGYRVRRGWNPPRYHTSSSL